MNTNVKRLLLEAVGSLAIIGLTIGANYLAKKYGDKLDESVSQASKRAKKVGRTYKRKFDKLVRD